jgi:hypothetical protein
MSTVVHFGAIKVRKLGERKKKTTGDNWEKEANATI